MLIVWFWSRIENGKIQENWRKIPKIFQINIDNLMPIFLNYKVFNFTSSYNTNSVAATHVFQHCQTSITEWTTFLCSYVFIPYFLPQLVTLYLLKFIKFQLFYDIAVSCMLEALFWLKNLFLCSFFSSLFSLYFYLFFHVLCTRVTQKVVVPSLGKLAFRWNSRFAICIMYFSLFFGGLCESLLNVEKIQKTYKSSSIFLTLNNERIFFPVL